VQAQNQHPEPEVLGGIQPERGQVLEQGYGGEYDETILGLTNTSFGVVACGWEEDATGNKRVVIYEIDSIGVLLNKYTYNTSGEQIANSIFPDGLGGYYVAGRSSLSYADFDEMNIGDTAWVFRIDNTGSILWEQKYKNTNEAEVGMNLLDAGNGYFWLLTNIINTQSGNQVRLRKIDSAGNTHTTATHGNSTGDLYAYELIENQDNNRVMLANDLNGSATPMLYELDDVGAEIANYSYSQAHPTRAFGLDELPQGGYVLAGEFDNGADLGAIVIKTDDAFIEDYVFERDNADDEYFRDLILDSTGAIAVGATENMGEGGFDGFIVHLDTLGDSVMTETLGRALDGVLMTATQSTQPTGGILAGGQSLGVGGNGYLIKAIKYGEIPCPLPRFLFVDGFVTGNRVSIDDSKTILGDTSKENALLWYAENENIKHLCLYGVNFLFEPDNANASRNGITYESLLNSFLTQAARVGVNCALISTPDTGTSAFHTGGLYNLTDSIVKKNYHQAGKIDYFQLEHEFWNANGVVAQSGITAWQPITLINDNQRNAHSESVYNDHIHFLDTLNTFRYNDANARAVYDYVDRLYFNWDTTSSVNHYKDTNDTARSLKAKELESKTNAIFLSHYRGHSSSYKNLRFLHYDTASSTVKRFTKRLSFFGQIRGKLICFRFSRVNITTTLILVVTVQKLIF